nr:hypothetical protein [Halomonas xinjiangensis]
MRYSLGLTACPMYSGIPSTRLTRMVRASIDTVIQQVKATGKAVGILATDAADARYDASLCFDFIAAGIDIMLLHKAARETLERVKWKVNCRAWQTMPTTEVS